VAWTPKNPRLARLAEQIRRLQQRGRKPPERCPSGLTELDAALGGGFSNCAVHELMAPQEGTPAYSLAWRIAARAAGRNYWIFYIDMPLDLNPLGVVQLGVPLERLVVVRTPATAEALWACEQALRCRAVAAVVLPLRSVDTYSSRRLQLAAEAGENLGLLICQEPRDGSTFAASRLRLEPRVAPPGTCRMEVTVLKQRAGRPGTPFVVEWSDAANLVPVSAVPVDRTGTPRYGVGG
jgi:protein ImuA